MKLLGYNKRIISGIGLFFILCFASMGSPSDIIHPFFLIPAAELEIYNYVEHITVWLRFLILFGMLYDTLYYLGRLINALEHLELGSVVQKIHKGIKKTTRIARVFTLISIIYCFKELIDYLTYENYIPDCFDHFWFLILWEMLPVAILFIWATLTAYRIIYHANNTNNSHA